MGEADSKLLQKCEEKVTRALTRVVLEIAKNQIPEI